MKKYLMTGIAAVAMCAAFTSCSHDVDPISQEQLDQLEAEKVFQNYEKAFIATFGQPAANQTWGFGGTAITRGHNADGNMWVSYGWTVPRELSREQKNRVIAYFQNNRLSDGGEKPWTDFFVQQVYKGGEENGAYVNIMNTNPALTTEQYQASGMTSPAYGSNTIDKLFADTDDHINNYNGGTCSTNYNVSNSEGISYLNPTSNNQHADQIMLMTGSHAKDFGYNCSNISIEYNNHYTLVDGSIIDQWAADHGNNIGESVSGRAFVGFDFDLLTPNDWYTEENFKITDLSSAITLCTYENGDVKSLKDAGIAGDYIYNSEPVKYLHYNATNMISGDIIYNVDNKCGIQDLQKPWGKTFNKKYIDDLIRDGYRPIKNAASTWVKPEITRDYYYSDWIVSIIPGKPENPYPNATSLRVMAEDLSATDASDFDFNDVVLDFVANEDGTAATIYLQAAGGTLPLRINENDAWEVHKLFGVATNVMVNTGATAKGLIGEENKPTVTVGTVPGDYSAEKFCESVNKVKIEVQKNGRWMELTANKGEACCKFACVPAYEYKWVPELENIDGYYTFSDWVKGFTTKLTKKINW